MTIHLGRHTLPGSGFAGAHVGCHPDLAFRRCVARCSDIAVVSEMVAGEALVGECPDVVRRAEGAGLEPFILQLVGPRRLIDGEGRRACRSGRCRHYRHKYGLSVAASDRAVCPARR